MKKMRNSGRAYPLMEITSLFLDHPDTCRVLIQVESTEPAHKLLQCAECGAATFDEKMMQNHILQNHMDLMFDEVVVEVEPPKGNFVCVRKCSLSGEILGPPNHNGTEERIRELHATRYSDIPLERYREHIKTLHDADLIEAWKEQFRKQTLYCSKPRPGTSEQNSPVADNVSEPDATVVASVDDIIDATASATEISVEHSEPGIEEPTQEDQSAQADSESESSTPGTIDAAAGPVDGLTWAEASQAFLRKHESRLTRRSFRATLPAGLARQMEDPQLRELLSDAWRRECRAPRSLAFALRGAFRHRKMHIFRAGKQVEFITSTVPTPLAPESAIDSISEVLRFLQENPGCTRKLLVEGLRPGASTDETMAREILAPLGWMIERGHIIEFFNGTLSVPKNRASSRR
ncbi:MAG: hypothetical protein O3C57_00010 [Verrucomicrobia bacterium]|nr:hypothetical protein [Verrucomicrobiota bacterium]